jgi:hypothetical protein
MSELSGRATKNTDQIYKSLLDQVVPLRSQFRREQSVEGRKKIATEEF